MGALAKSKPIAGRVYTCMVDTIRAAVDDEDRAEIDRRLAGHSCRAVAGWLSDHGYPISDGSVLKHQQRRCQCFKVNHNG